MTVGLFRHDEPHVRHSQLTAVEDPEALALADRDLNPAVPMSYFFFAMNAFASNSSGLSLSERLQRATSCA